MWLYLEKAKVNAFLILCWSLSAQSYLKDSESIPWILKDARKTYLHRQQNSQSCLHTYAKYTYLKLLFHTYRAQFVFQWLKSADTEFLADCDKPQEVTVGNMFCQNTDGSWQCWLARVAWVSVIKNTIVKCNIFSFSSHSVDNILVCSRSSKNTTIPVINREAPDNCHNIITGPPTWSAFKL